MRKLILALAIAATAALAIPALAATTKTVRLKTGPDRFSPASVTVTKGDKVKFVWSQGTHNVVASNSKNKPWKDIGIRRKGDSPITRTASKTGKFALECTLHPGMDLSVRVKRP